MGSVRSVNRFTVCPCDFPVGYRLHWAQALSLPWSQVGLTPPAYSPGAGRENPPVRRSGPATGRGHTTGYACCAPPPDGGLSALGPPEGQGAPCLKKVSASALPRPGNPVRLPADPLSRLHQASRHSLTPRTSQKHLQAGNDLTPAPPERGRHVPRPRRLRWRRSLPLLWWKTTCELPLRFSIQDMAQPQLGENLGKTLVHVDSTRPHCDGTRMRRKLLKKQEFAMRTQYRCNAGKDAHQWTVDPVQSILKFRNCKG
jgi:hypothetical protein